MTEYSIGTLLEIMKLEFY